MERPSLRPLPRTAIAGLAAWIFLLAGSIPPAAATESASGQVIVALKPGFDIAKIHAAWGTSTLDSYPPGDLYLISVPEGMTASSFSAKLKLDPVVDESDENYVQETPEGVRQMVFSAGGGTGDDYLDQAAATRIGLTESHRVTRGAGVVVAVLDTGIDPDHPAFANRIHPAAYDFVDNDSDPTETANGIDEDGDGLVDEGFGHGSMVAGIVALVAPDATILPLRVLDDEGHGQSFQVAKAIRYAQIHGAQVLNLSFGVPQTVSAIGKQIRILQSSGIAIVAGAGNEGRENPPYYPAIDSKTFMVTALNPDDHKAGFADYESHVLVSAPGVGILAPYPGAEWATGSGCSFATPFVTGEIALIMSAYPGASLEWIEDLVRNSVQPIDDLPQNFAFRGKLGSGRIYIPFALPAAVGITESDPIQPPFLISPNPSRGPIEIRGSFPGGTSALVFDANGRLIRELEGSSPQLVWDSNDGFGRPVPSGVYYLRLVQAGDVPSIKFVILR